MSTALKEKLAQALALNGYTFDASTEKQFIHFLELLQKWNQVFNLTSLKETDELIYLHILDSLSIYPYLEGTRLLDVGSGGGLPGLPLAIVDPHKTWVLLDKSQKKTRFLLQAVTELGLKNVKVVCSRCEDFQSEAGFDSIVSRAFGTIQLFLESTKHLLSPTGYFLAMKGVYPDKELAEIPATFTVLDVQKLIIRGLQAERHLVKVQQK
jgi:16S rRNA (guanine527-N7)-methyltransferase